MGFMNLGKKKADMDSDDSFDVPPPPPLGGMGESPMPNRPLQSEPPMHQGMPPPIMPPQNQGMPPPIKSRQSSMAPPFDSLDNNQLPPEQQDDTGIDIPPIANFDPDSSRQKRSFDDMFKPPRDQPESEPEPEPEEEYAPEPEPEPDPEPEPESDEDMTRGTDGRRTFIEVNRYRQILKDLKNIRKSLKDSDGEISKIIGDINDEERIFSVLHATLTDVEQKLSRLETDFFHK